MSGTNSHETALDKLKAILSRVPDPRVNRNKEHPLINILVIGLSAVLCGANHWTEVAFFGRSKESFFRKVLDLSNGIPSHDTFGKVFSALDPKFFGSCLTEWVRHRFELPAGVTLNIDGKSLRGSWEPSQGKSGTHLISAWVNELGLSFAQQCVDSGGNEITAIPALLAMIDLGGTVVTIDAIGCQPDIAASIKEAGADYILAVRGNRENLLQEVTHLFTVRPPAEECETIEKGHGRIEKRKLQVIQNLDWMDEQEVGIWKGLACVIKVDSERWANDKEQKETRYYICSLNARASDLLRRIRGHWAIENSLHWCLDVGFREDESRVRKNHAPENFAVLRKWALNILRQDKTVKLGIESKRKGAAWDEKYLVKLLNDCFLGN